MEVRNFGEILSPAGNTEMLIAAVRSGADAVYLGAKDFSARRNAQNFSLDELKEAVGYCHIRGVKVYLALNILIKENELSKAFSLAQEAYNLGIDGIIVEDLGLASLLHREIPQLPLHASTQMSVHSPSALPILKKLGFTQVVAAREMSKSELKALCEKADALGITVEVFIHGALCMCMSGQCLLSAFLGSRSGNRGLCAGPCRLPFKAENGTGYDLSLKDLSLLEYIRELYDMGVRSFKIEGRMKRPEYVAAATFAARQALDEGSVDQNLNQTLKNVFSRQGFTDGYYKNSLGKNMFGIRTKEDVLSADKSFPLLHEIYRNERQSVALTVTLKIKLNEAVLLSFSDGINTAEAKGEIPQTAKNKALSKEDALKSVCKLGSTPYFCEKSEILLDDGLFVSVGELNRLRREAVEQLNRKRADINLAYSEKSYIKETKKRSGKIAPKLYARFEKISQIPQDISALSCIIIPLEENPNDLKLADITLAVDIPRGIINEALIEKRLKLFKENGFKIALCGNLAAVEIAKNAGFIIGGNSGLNITNSESLKTAEALGFSAAVISCEEEIKDIAELYSPIEKGIIAYGNIPLMIFKNCPLKNGKSCSECDKSGVITDRLGTEFPIRCRMGYSELLNSLPIYLADRQGELLGIDFEILYFTREDKNRVSKIINAYKNGLSADTKYTRGLYYRGTI